MRKLRLFPIAAAFIFFLSGGPSLQAQDIHAGVHGSYGSESFADAGLGVHATYLLTQMIAGAASFTWHFPGDDFRFWDLNLNAHYRFPIDAQVTPYIGAGANYSRLSFPAADDIGFGGGRATDTELGLNLLGGAFADLGPSIRFFGEGRFVISDADQFVLTLGLSLLVGN